MNAWFLLALAGVADSALVVIVDGIPADQLTKRVGAVDACAALARPRVDEGARRRRTGGDPETRGQRQRRVIPLFARTSFSDPLRVPCNYA